MLSRANNARQETPPARTAAPRTDGAAAGDGGMGGDGFEPPALSV
jgi:hypothetical protein